MLLQRNSILAVFLLSFSSGATAKPLCEETGSGAACREGFTTPGSCTANYGVDSRSFSVCCPPGETTTYETAAVCTVEAKAVTGVTMPWETKCEELGASSACREGFTTPGTCSVTYPFTPLRTFSVCCPPGVSVTYEMAATCTVTGKSAGNATAGDIGLDVGDWDMDMDMEEDSASEDDSAASPNAAAWTMTAFGVVATTAMALSGL